MVGGAMFGGTKTDEDRYKGCGFKKVKVEEVEEKKWAPPPRDREEGEDLGRDLAGGLAVPGQEAR